MKEGARQEINYKKFVIDSRLRYFKPHSSNIEKNFAEEISQTLSSPPRSIPPKYFYDKRGSELFDKICKQPEYYPTRKEIDILGCIKKELPSFLNSVFRLVELGSGSAEKTRLLLDVFAQIQQKIDYFPIDVSDILADSSEQLLGEYCNLYVTGIIDTYEGGLEFIKNYDNMNNFIIFLGSSFGNFSPEYGRQFLYHIGTTMNDDDFLLLGLDLVKEKDILDSAYDDSGGVTAKFNRNVLLRINRELEGDFDIDNFAHTAFYNEEKQRVEMYLKSLKKQSVRIKKANLTLDLCENELIHTEYSYKYSISQIKEMMGDAGFVVEKVWTDSDNYYAMILAQTV